MTETQDFESRARDIYARRGARGEGEKKRLGGEERATRGGQGDSRLVSDRSPTILSHSVETSVRGACGTK